jgi:two-component system response regulator ArlR
MQKILIIEDEESIISFLKPELQHEGYSVDAAMDGETGLNLLEQSGADLVLLDIMLPNMNGFAVLRRIRSFSEVPVIVLTARGQTMDKVLGLDCGADDYLTKPFEIEELLARIRSALRRQKKTAGDILKFMDITMNVPARRVNVGEENVELTAKEFDLLNYLMQNVNHAMTRDQILNSVWGYDFFGDSKVVDVYIRYLRNKLDERFSKSYITTIRGVGYAMRDEI